MSQIYVKQLSTFGSTLYLVYLLVMILIKGYYEKYALNKKYYQLTCLKLSQI